MIIKYKLGELAKDLNLPNKDVVTLLGDFGADKKHTSVLSQEELNFVFDAVTKKYETESFDKYFVEHNPALAPKKPPVSDGSGFTASQRQKLQKPITETVSQQPKKADIVNRVVDTRATNVDLDRYSGKYEQIAESSRNPSANKRKSNTQFTAENRR